MNLTLTPAELALMIRALKFLEDYQRSQQREEAEVTALLAKLDHSK
jgi:hypothetical protein